MMRRNVALFILTLLYFTIERCLNCANFNLTTRCYTKVRNNVYRLYATKTTFTENQLNLGDKIELDYHRLKELKDWKPIMLYVVARHAIRFPDREDIEEMSQYLPQIRDEILKNRGELCDDDVKAFENWRFQMTPDDDNNVCERGREETILTAFNLRKIFKKLLNPREAKISIGVTEKTRTSQTADTFITGLRLYDKVKNIIDSDDSSEESSDKAWRKHSHWMPKKEAKDILRFHAKCKKVYKQNGGKLEKPKAVIELRNSDLVSSLGKRVKERLGIATAGKNLSDYQFVEVIAKACRFEYACQVDTPWCSAFGEPELKVLEYIEDLEDFLDDAYGRKLNGDMACPLVKDLTTKLRNAAMSNSKRQSFLYFTHAGALKRFYTTLHLFADNDMLVDKSPENGYCSRENRKWRSSLNAPFGANFVIALYEKKKSRKSRQKEHIVVAFVNGKSEIIRKCSSKFCPLEEFLSKFADSENCDLNQICKPNIHNTNNTESSVPIEDNM
ncbi:Multiple inositol polyphosphate phosphatase 1-like protein [Dinothrombium tinctorium]|uniref:Multiple inositol polyphosphate phosphatase 1 n=1 Tax=Dinothrombium tinctorium TaxID=1965070 RepID=A0A3S3PDE2_9ACAR|nr:Multiple inositol polyphosphate phosphatase 1-like protein [Dinothrombium tinctorium]RWS17179.1 Multiple inositol polyphosphate phosphatase 1-like protein [Dinothrombium tinctorium]